MQICIEIYSNGLFPLKFVQKCQNCALRENSINMRYMTKWRHNVYNIEKESKGNAPDLLGG